MPRGRKPTWPPPVSTRDGKEFVRVCQDGRRKWITLGPAGSPEAKAEFARICAEMAANQGRLPLDGHADLTVLEAVTEWLARQPGQTDVRTSARRKRAAQGVLDLYGPKPLADFGPLALKAVRKVWEGEGLSRRYVNHLTNSVRSWIRWCVGEQLLDRSYALVLDEVDGLRRGWTEAREPERIRPVARWLVEATLPHLPPVVADMVRLQLWTGMRPGEVCVLAPADLTRPWKTVDGVLMWLYALTEHKTGWRGHLRWVPIGPKAQELLLPYIDGRPPDAYCFSPAESRERWLEGRRAARKTALSCGNRPGSRAARRQGPPQKLPGSRYTTHSYGQTIGRACERAGLEHWSPNQLRHLVGTDVETSHGREDARCVLGHKNPTVTAVYAEQVERAAKVIARLG